MAAGKKRWYWMLAWLACTTVSLAIFAKPKTTPIHPDEVYWIGSTYYYHLAFERGDWRGTHPDWALQPARENPPVAKYVVGLGLALAGQRVTVRDMLGCFHLMFFAPGAWGEGEDRAKRVAVVGDMTLARCGQAQGGPGVTRPRALPYLARYVMVVCAALTSLVVFLFGASAGTTASGFLASQLLLAHPYMIHAYNRTMADPVALLFSAASAFACWELFRRLAATASPRLRTIVGLAGLNAALLALACGAKMNALVVVLLFGGAAATAAAICAKRGDRAGAMAAVVTGVATLIAAFAIFVAINPAVLRDVAGGLEALFVEPQRNTAIQARVMFQLHLDTPLEKAAAMTHLAGGPVLFLLMSAAAQYAVAKRRAPGMWFVTAWWAIAVVCVTAWLPFDWSRYLLPALPPFALLVAHAVVAGAEHLWRARTRSRIGAT